MIEGYVSKILFLLKVCWSDSILNTWISLARTKKRTYLSGTCRAHIQRGSEQKNWRQNMGACRQKWEFDAKKLAYTDKFSILMARNAEKSFCGIKFADGRQSRGACGPSGPSLSRPCYLYSILHVWGEILIFFLYLVIWISRLFVEPVCIWINTIRIAELLLVRNIFIWNIYQFFYPKNAWFTERGWREGEGKG